jgi:hypothetical protein
MGNVNFNFIAAWVKGVGKAQIGIRLFPSKRADWVQEWPVWKS